MELAKVISNLFWLPGGSLEMWSKVGNGAWQNLLPWSENGVWGGFSLLVQCGAWSKR